MFIGAQHSKNVKTYRRMIASPSIWTKHLLVTTTFTYIALCNSIFITPATTTCKFFRLPAALERKSEVESEELDEHQK